MYIAIIIKEKEVNDLTGNMGGAELSKGRGQSNIILLQLKQILKYPNVFMLA